MMHLSALLPLFIVPFAASISSHHPQHVFSNPPKSTAKTFRIPTVRESAIQARRILHLSSIGTLSSVFPSSSNNLERRPADVGGSPIGLMDYYASCSPTPSEPIILAVSIATAMKNAAAGSNITLSMRYHPPSDHPPSDDIYTYSPANLPRFSLIGYLEPIPSCEVSKHKIKECFLEEHPDAEIWTPGNDIHESYWARLVVEEVYWFGGFGDRAYIGWIPLNVWKGVTMEEVEECRLVGEKGYGNGKKEEENVWNWAQGKGSQRFLGGKVPRRIN